MKQRPLLWQLYGSYLFVVFISLAAASWYASQTIKSLYVRETSSYLQTAIQLIQETFPEALTAETKKVIDHKSKEVGRHMFVRLTVILPDGEVIADSEEEPGFVGNQSDRPEILGALAGHLTLTSRYNPVRQKTIMWMASPLTKDGRVIAIIRASSPVQATGQAMHITYAKIAFGVLLIAGLAAVVSFLVSRRLSKPLEEIRTGAERLAQGDFGTRLKVGGTREIAHLAETMNETAMHLERLENLRRDFVANVSHELKTPLTSIKGAVETLQSHASNDPTATQGFLIMISKEVERLNTLIENLLTLSRIERVHSHVEVPLEEGPISKVLCEAMHLCEIKAKDKHVSIELSIPNDVSLPMNSPLLESAVANLLDNALKYSQPGSSIALEGQKTSSGVAIHVRDQGCGIEPEHLPRLFERFYRVDKARTRKLGGTGLGLAIVKHIAQAHGGNVTVASTPGKGSIFTINLPSGKDS